MEELTINEEEIETEEFFLDLKEEKDDFIEEIISKEEIMTEEKFESSEEHFQRRNNMFKCQLVYFETGADVICHVIRLLYKDPQPLKEKLSILETEKCIRFNSDEQPKIENFKNGTYVLSDLDFSLLFKIVQAVCGLKPIKDNIWTKHCPKNQREELEHLLYKLKVGRNNFAHPGPEEKNISDDDLPEKLKEIKELLLSIVRKGEEKGGLQSQNIEVIENFVCDDLKRICGEGVPADSLKEEMKEYKLMMDRKLEEHICLYNKVREQLQRISCIPNLNLKSFNQVRVVNVFKKGFTNIKKKPRPPKQNAAKTKINLPKRNASQNKPHPPRQNTTQAKPNPSKQNTTQKKQPPRQNTTQTKSNPPKQNATQNKQPPRQNTTQAKPNPPKQNATQNKQPPRQNTAQAKPNPPKQNATQNKQPPRENTTQAKPKPTKQKTSQNKPHPPKQNPSQSKSQPKK